MLAEKDADAIRPVMNQMNELELNLSTYLLEEMDQADHHSAGEVYLDGISNVLAEPEFSGSEEARRPLRLLEDEETLKDMISRTLQGSSVGMVQVLIGGEGTWDDLRQCSLVLARYGAPGLATGSLGVIGPMRMSYGHTISTVRFLSGLLTDLVSESLGDDNTEFAR
jgi:heat-inducible transcriptional repressor